MRLARISASTLNQNRNDMTFIIRIIYERFFSSLQLLVSRHGVVFYSRIWLIGSLHAVCVSYVAVVKKERAILIFRRLTASQRMCLCLPTNFPCLLFHNRDSFEYKHIPCFDCKNSHDKVWRWKAVRLVPTGFAFISSALLSLHMESLAVFVIYCRFVYFFLHTITRITIFSFNKPLRRTWMIAFGNFIFTYRKIGQKNPCACTFPVVL